MNSIPSHTTLRSKLAAASKDFIAEAITDDYETLIAELNGELPHPTTNQPQIEEKGNERSD